MSAAAKLNSFSPRIPRYNLVADDDGRVRMAEGNIHDGPILEGKLKNISATGALIEINHAHAHTRFLDEGEMIKLELAVPAHGRFAFFATVVRLEPTKNQNSLPQTWQLGLVFRNLPGDLARTLDKAVTPRAVDHSHPGNFEWAAQRGFKHAANRVTFSRLRALSRVTAESPQWWLVTASFIVASLLATFWPLLLRY